MVATRDCAEKSKSSPGNKVSKPLMEKKRRARINKCLDQLKSLLETYYSSNIRKRKLEKADILELTVKHLRNLQKTHSCAAAAPDFADYQTGFRSCLANVGQYLLMADKLKGSWRLSQLSGELSLCRGQEEVFSTLESGLCRAEAQDEARRLLPPAAGPEQRKAAKSKALKPHSPTRCPASPCEDASPEQSSPDRSHKFVSHRNEAANPQRDVWRPW